MEKPAVKRRTCLSCRKRLHQPATGRPRVYCGPECRRAAEYELRRIQSQLGQAEKNERTARAEYIAGPQWNQSAAQKRSQYWDLEAAKLRDRLQHLLAGNCADDDDEELR